jgi:hypothetical protein
MSITIPSTPFTLPTVLLPAPIPGPPGPPGPGGLTGVIDASTFGTVGNGIADDTAALQAAINAAFVVCTSNSATQPPGNKVLYIPPGTYKITSPLTMIGTFGGVMAGAGRFATQIFNPIGGCIVTQGFQYNRFENFSLSAGAGNICLQLTWDGVHNCALQQCTFENMNFGGGALGVTIGDGGFQGDGMTFINCSFSSLTTAGIFTTAFNALATRVYGGDFQSCGTGIKVGVGSVPVISGTSFEANTLWDIDIEGSAGDCYSVTGCRSESVNFAKFTRGNATVSGCCQIGAGPGTFVSSTFHAVGIYNCISQSGQLDLADGDVACCEFGRLDWVSGRHSSKVRSTYFNGTIDLGGTPTYVFDGHVASGVVFNDNISTAGLLLTDAVTVATDASQNSIFFLIIAGNRTLANPTNLRTGVTYQWFIQQAAGGNHTLAYDTKFKWPGGVAAVLSTAAGAIDIVTATYDGTNLYGSIQKAFA